jgi:hypothetical protein
LIAQLHYVLGKGGMSGSATEDLKGDGTPRNRPNQGETSGCRRACLVDALHGHHAQARCTLAQLPRLLVGLRLIPAPSGRQVVKLKHHQAGWLPVTLEDGQLAAADEAAATSRGDRGRRRGLVLRTAPGR